MIPLYRRLLRLYPRSFRDRFGAAMVETFAEEWKAARRRGAGAALLLALRTLAALPLLALRERAEEMRRGGGTGSGPGSWGTDVAHAVRSMSRAPGFALITVVTVGLGVGATVSIYSIADGLLLRELPVSEPERLVRVHEERSRYLSVGPEGARIPVERYETVREALTGSAFSGLAGHNTRILSVRGDGPAFAAMGSLASGNYFAVLGIRPALGRFFTSDDEATVVLGHRVWQTRFGGRADVVGRTVHLGGRPFTVIGVAPAGFASTIGFVHAGFFVPIGAHDGEIWPRAGVHMFGRLAPGVEAEAARERAAAVFARIPVDEDPGAELLGARLEPLDAVPPGMAKQLRGFLGLLFGTAVLVLLVAGANVAGILVARAGQRSRETAVRLALGVGRGRLARQWMLEAVTLFTLGGLVGTGIAVLVTDVVSRLRLPTAEPVVLDAGPGLVALGLALAIAVLAGLLFGWMPALHASRVEPATTLRNGERGSTRGGTRLRSLFVTVQIAVSVVLLVGATLFVRTAHRNLTVDPGFDPERVVIAEVNLAPHGYVEDEGRAFFDGLAQELRALPGVESVSLAALPLLTGQSSSFGAWRLHPDDPGVSARSNQVDGHYFETLGIRPLAGRGIEPGDAAGAPEVIVVNESFARRFWPDEDPVGRTVLRGDRPYRVVGVTPDGRYVDFAGETSLFTFLSVDQRYAARRTVHLRHRPGVEPQALIASVRAVVASLDPDVAVSGAMPLSRAMASLLFPQRFAAALIGAFGVLGLFLAATGVYGVLSHLVVQRTREFGIRIALGAEGGALLAMVLWRGALLAGVGAVVGLGLAAAATRFLADLLPGISPWDPVSFLTVPILLGVVALVASLIPARRVLGVDPVEALRR